MVNVKVEWHLAFQPFSVTTLIRSVTRYNNRFKEVNGIQSNAILHSQKIAKPQSVPSECIRFLFSVGVHYLMMRHKSLIKNIVEVECFLSFIIFIYINGGDIWPLCIRKSEWFFSTKFAYGHNYSSFNEDEPNFAILLTKRFKQKSKYGGCAMAKLPKLPKKVD